MTAAEPSAMVFDHLYLAPDDPRLASVPNVDGSAYVLNGELLTWTGAFRDIYSPVLTRGSDKPNIVLGKYPMMTEAAAMAALDSSVKAYNYGQGQWPTMSAMDRIAALRKFVAGLRERRQQIVDLIVWEICKTPADAQKEVDRTIQYVEDTLATLTKFERDECELERSEGVTAQLRRAPYGVVLCSGPFNYPFNETYTTLIPALAMGNAVLMKLPRHGVLCHWPTFALFAECFPPGVVNIVCGSGRETMTPLMRSGLIDILAFIGTSNAADALQRAHPRPHRLRCCLGLEAKNPAIILPDADLPLAVRECVAGALSFNGQRCTALKMLMVHESVAPAFLDLLVAAVDALPMGLPWAPGAAITPLPEEGKPGYLADLLADALAHGAQVLNPHGGVGGGRTDRTFVAPAVVYPVTPAMRLYHEEQFGPLVPVRTWAVPADVYAYLAASPYGQQASLFSRDPAQVGHFVDVLANQVSRVNLNAQCQRGPDTLPFTGRKASAYGTLSVFDALRVFSLRALVATKDSPANLALFDAVRTGGHSTYLRHE